jgi:hypothetical protein
VSFPNTHLGLPEAATPPVEGILQRWLRMDFGIELDKSKVGVKMVRLLRAPLSGIGRKALQFEP